MSTETKLTKNDVIALEKSYWDAIKKKDGNRTVELSGNHALVTGVQGVMCISKDKLGKMTEEGRWALESYVFDDVNVSIPTADVAIIAYTVRQNITMDGKKQEIKAAECSAWLRSANGWECHAHSETFLKND